MMIRKCARCSKRWQRKGSIMKDGSKYIYRCLECSFALARQYRTIGRNP